MYSIADKKYVNKGLLVDKTELIDIDGFFMASQNKVFQIQGSNIRKIRVVNKNLANPLVTKKVLGRYKQLVGLIMELLVEDDDSGETCREALNQIEKFRMELKNKYRDYLSQVEMEKILKHLALLEKESKQKLFEIEHQYQMYQNDNRRSR